MKNIEFKLTPAVLYTIKAISVVLAAIIIIMLIGLIPSHLSKYDMTQNGMYTLSNISKETVKKIDKNVTINLVFEEGQENETLKVFIERYKKLSKHIKFRQLDIKEDAVIISTFTTDTIASNSLIIESDTNFIIIPYSELFYYSPEAYFNAYYSYLQYSQEGYISCSFTDFMDLYAPLLGLYDGFCFEKQITTAINYVTGNTKVVYLLTGHNETALSRGIQNRICTEGIEIRLLDLNTNEIPSDADAIWILPVNDITSTESDKLKSYVSSGGKIMLLTTYGKTRSNLDAFLSDYGVINTNSYLCEDNPTYCMSHPSLILPNIPDPGLSEQLDLIYGNVMLGGTTGITVSDNLPDGVNVNPLLISSPEAYLKAETSDFQYNEETDTRAAYYGSVDIKTSSGEIIWFASQTLLNEEYDVYTNGGNEETFIYYLNALTENNERIQIQPKLSTLSEISVTPNVVFIYLAVFGVCLPIGFILIGVIRKYRRVNK